MSLFHPNELSVDVGSWYRAATEKRELLAMDDRMLRDVGLTRIDALQIAKRRSTRILRFEPRGPSRPGPIAPEIRAAAIKRAHRLRDEAIRNVFVAVLAALRAWIVPQPSARLRKLTPVTR